MSEMDLSPAGSQSLLRKGNAWVGVYVVVLLLQIPASGVWTYVHIWKDSMDP